MPHDANFQAWLKSHNWAPETLTAQELAFLRAAYEQELKNPKRPDGPAAVLNKIESGAG